MRIGFLATGDEIISGDVTNTNTKEIAHRLTQEGFISGMHLAVGDDMEDIITAFQFLKKDHDILIVVGGLGPTSDDKTRFAIAKVCHLSLETYEEALSHIKERLRIFGLEMSEGNKTQALFPPMTTLLPNSNGSAFGGLFQYEEKVIVLLPGPPTEALPMFDTYVLPTLRPYFQKDKVLLHWLVFGIAEGEIARRIDEALKDFDVRTGYRIDWPYTECKVICKPSDVDTVKKQIEPLLAPYIISPPDQKASSCLLSLILSKKTPLFIEDKATGGLLETLLLCPESYPYLRFHIPQTNDMLCYITGLENLWKHGKTDDNSVTIRIIKNQKEILEEAHQIPKGTKRILLSHAAEWVCFRLLQIFSSPRP